MSTFTLSVTKDQAADNQRVTNTQPTDNQFFSLFLTKKGSESKDADQADRAVAVSMDPKDQVDRAVAVAMDDEDPSTSLHIYLTSGNRIRKLSDILTDEQKKKVDEYLAKIQQEFPNMDRINLSKSIMQFVDSQGVTSETPIYKNEPLNQPIFDLINYLDKEIKLNTSDWTVRNKGLKGDQNELPALRNPERRKNDRINELLAEGEKIEGSYSLNELKVPKKEQSSAERRLQAVRLLIDHLKEAIRSSKSQANGLYNQLREKSEEHRDGLDRFAIEYALLHPFKNMAKAEKDITHLQKLIEGRKSHKKSYYVVGEDKRLTEDEKNYAVDVIGLNISDHITYHKLMQKYGLKERKSGLEDFLVSNAQLLVKENRIDWDGLKNYLTEDQFVALKPQLENITKELQVKDRNSPSLSSLSEEKGNSFSLDMDSDIEEKKGD